MFRECREIRDTGLNPRALEEQVPAFAGIRSDKILAREGGRLHFRSPAVQGRQCSGQEVLSTQFLSAVLTEDKFYNIMVV